MNKKDKQIRQRLSNESMEIPSTVKSKIEQTLMQLPKQEQQPVYSNRKRFAYAFACIAFIMLFLLPNVSTTYAKTLEQIPIIGELVKVVTIRNYYYADDKHEMDIHVPKVDNEENGAFDAINADVEELTQMLVERFYKDLETFGGEGHSSVYVNYEVVTNTDSWFTLKLIVNEVAGSGNTYYKYYHLNKLTGATVTLEDIISDKAFYQVVAEDIKQQMREEMAQDSNLKYWVDDSTFGDDIVSIDGKHNFYFNKENDLVIPFDKYEVAPGYMGTSEFVVDKDLIMKFLHPQMKKILAP